MNQPQPEAHVSAQDAELVINAILSNALCEPQYSEACSDVLFAMKEKYATMPQGPVPFQRILLIACQQEYDRLPTSLEASFQEQQSLSPAEIALELERRKQKWLATVKFMGHLFLRNLIAIKVIGQIVHDLIGISATQPMPHSIECACELIKVIGPSVDSSQSGKDLMAKFCARLQDLKRSQEPEGSATYTNEVRRQIQDLLELRARNWQTSSF